MKKEIRTAVYDKELHIEAYRFEGIIQPFPNHFHEYYVIGFVEHGERYLSCKNKEYHIQSGNIILFNPGDTHACTQSDDGTFAYRGFNISSDVMLDLTAELTGQQKLPSFAETVITDDEICYYLHTLHKMLSKPPYALMSDNDSVSDSFDFGKEETLLLLISSLLQKCGWSFSPDLPEYRHEVETTCEFIREHFPEHISLDQLCNHAGLSRSTLLRTFTKAKGITPYRYLETVRINEAKHLLQKGTQPVDAAIQTGFSDQSHFTNYFSSFIGLAPGAYREIFITGKKEGES